MEILQSDVLQIRQPEDIVLVRTAVRKIAIASKLGLVDQTKLVTAASEIARNTLDYGLGGEVRVDMVRDARTGVRLTFTDEGPGIPDLERAMTDGWTSGKGMGLGLSGTRRLMDEFQIASKVGEGTTVTIAKWSR
ncbi:serine/threonine-protein kinase RsbT [Granulicella rosea]|uniref:Serine/threonine-protein kinase RsbT n=1 Tax=Granulicella rosea TaxID=474952 RepID=A0A239KT93_9BACT|nr:anti-sigma regulatory factor [Granulicella rosea]SNT20942.1 serine/threonine-protein kinase RsbT [Granulicella rosea]